MDELVQRLDTGYAMITDGHITSTELRPELDHRHVTVRRQSYAFGLAEDALRASASFIASLTHGGVMQSDIWAN